MLQRKEARLPCQLQLAKADVAIWVVVPRRTEFDVLRLFVITEADLCRLIEAADDVVEVFEEVRLFQNFYTNMYG